MLVPSEIEAEFLKELNEPGRLLRLRAGEEIVYIDPEREAEAARAEQRLGLTPPRLLHEIPEGWTAEEECDYQNYRACLDAGRSFIRFCR